MLLEWPSPLIFAFAAISSAARLGGTAGGQAIRSVSLPVDPGQAVWAGGGFPPSLACHVLRVAHGALSWFEGDFGLGFGDAFPPRPRIFFDNGVRLSGLLGVAQRQLLVKPRRSLPPHGGLTTSGALPMRCSPEPGESPRQGRH